jgi:hypothetical protein
VEEGSQVNRRGFLASIFKAAAAGAVSSCVRWLPMPEAASIKVFKATQPGLSLSLNSRTTMGELLRLHYYQHVQALENECPCDDHAAHLHAYRCTEGP